MPPKEATTAKTPMSAPHLAWAGGHAIIVLSTAYIMFKLVTFRTPSTYVYSLAYAGALVSWGVVVYKTLGVPTASKAYVQRFLGDENGEYFLLALFWFLTKPVWISVLPFATFSLFHTLTFVRTTFLPPPSKAPVAAAGQAQAQQPANLSRTIQTWVKKNYEPAMRLVAYTEVVGILPYLVIGVLLRRNALVAPLFFSHFLRLRYFLSAQTREAFAYINAQLETKVLGNTSVPEPVKKGIIFARKTIVGYAENMVQPPQGGAAPAAGAR